MEDLPPGQQSSTAEGLSPGASPTGSELPVLSNLVQAVQERETVGRGRRWASRKRQELMKRFATLRRAREAGLSKREIREGLAKDGITVSKWLVDDILHGVKPGVPHLMTEGVETDSSHNDSSV